MRHVIKDEAGAVDISVVARGESPAATEISVIVRDLEPGQAHEVRHVRPGKVVMGPAGIDWEATPYTAYVLVSPDEAEEAQ